MNVSSPRPTTVKLAFEPDTVDLAIEQLVSLKILRPGIKDSKKYAQIRGSVKAIGLVEAPVVARNPDDATTFFLLDGHLRIECLKDLGIARVECLVSTDDETYTYNKRINRLAAVQEHNMIKRAIARGVPEAAIAEALGLDIKTIFRRTRLLNGICPEAVEVLKDTSTPMAVFDLLRRMGPLRQVEAAELMVGQHNYSLQFAKALLAATPDTALAVPRRKPPKRDGQISTEQMAKMERELASLQSQVKSFEETYGLDTLHLTVARGYIRKLLGNPKVVSWLKVICDPNQAIYGFRGGVKRELGQFAETFSADERLPMSGNFRSSGHITKGVIALRAPGKDPGPAAQGFDGGNGWRGRSGRGLA